MLGLVFVIVAGIVSVVVMEILLRTESGETRTDDELENNPYDVPRPEGRMIDRFGYK